MKKLQVDVGCTRYPIYIGKDILSKNDYFPSLIKTYQVVVVSQANISEYYFHYIKKKLIFNNVICINIPEGDLHKNMDTFNFIVDQMLLSGSHKDTTLISLGGGMVSDISGFVASCYQRGISFIQIPTTLLAQVDASIGGKTGINHVQGKNMIGTFYHPKGVFIDINFLKSLPEREFLSGIAEIIKYAILSGQEFFNWLSDNLDAVLMRKPSILTEVITRSCKVKIDFVSKDEKDQDVRKLLNFGHTFAHAIETFFNYDKYLHGEAVSIGMVLATKLSYKLGYTKKSNLELIISLLKRAKLPIDAPIEMLYHDFFNHMLMDKKVLEGKINYLLIRELGCIFLSDKIDHKFVKEIIRDRGF